MVQIVDGGIQLRGNDNDTTPIWRDGTELEELAKIILERNLDHLRQATSDGTPIALGPLVDLFGLYVTTVMQMRIKYSMNNSTLRNFPFRRT